MGDTTIERTDQYTTEYAIMLRSGLFEMKDSEDPAAQKHWFYKDLIMIEPFHLIDDGDDTPLQFDISIIVNLPASPTVLNELRDLLGLTLYATFLRVSKPAAETDHVDLKIGTDEYLAIIDRLEADFQG